MPARTSVRETRAVIIYLDTNIILDVYDSQRPNHELIRRILKQKDLNFVTGVITILEFESVVGRAWTNSQFSLEGLGGDLPLADLQELPLPQQVKAITDFCFARLPVAVMSLPVTERLVFGQTTFQVDSVFRLMYDLNPKTFLRTLDNLQLATALSIRQYSDTAIEFFLTGDEMIIHHGREIKNATGIIPVSPGELASMLKLTIR
ncbi:MAG: type II toxin-antitoxin system VapC family toxin [Promethearchaeota archaeon]